MKFTLATISDSLPVPLTVRRLSSVSQCFQCMAILSAESLGAYQGSLFCDDCADGLRPRRYNADLSEIVLAADSTCAIAVGVSIRESVQRGSVALVEDDWGDLVYRSENSHQLLIGAPALGESTIDYLPQEVRLSHRILHRESVKTQSVRDCIQTICGQHWTCKILPFVAVAEIFTMTLFQAAV